MHMQKQIINICAYSGRRKHAKKQSNTVHVSAA